MKDKTSVSHDEVMVKELRKDPAFAAEYLKAAMEDTEEPQVLLIALRQIADAYGGVAKIAKAAGIERESLYRALCCAAIHVSPPLRRHEGNGIEPHGRGWASHR